MRCAERARLVVVLRERSAATHVAAIRQAAISATFLPCLIASFVVRARDAAGVVHLPHVQAHQRSLTFQSFSPARARVESENYAEPDRLDLERRRPKPA